MKNELFLKLIFWIFFYVLNRYVNKCIDERWSVNHAFLHFLGFNKVYYASFGKVFIQVEFRLHQNFYKQFYLFTYI